MHGPVSAGSEGRDVHSLLAHVLGRMAHELRRDPAALVDGIDGDHVHDAHAVVERIQRDGREPDRLPIGDGDEDVLALVAQLDRTASACTVRQSG